MIHVSLQNVGFGYDKKCPVLRDINLDLAESGLYCIIGPNGVGKSTLVRCINKLIEPDQGSITVNGKDLKDYTIQELSELMGFVPASSSIAFPMSVVDSILIGLNSKDKWRVTNEDLAKVYKVLNVMRMRDLALRNCNELSAGQVQKVAICRGIVRPVDLLILDEPTANLDIKHQIFVADFMHELAKATDSIVLMISHDLNIAARYADHIIVMSRPGVIYAEGTPIETITPEMIRDVYDVEAEVFNKEGKPFVFLERALNW